MVLQTEEPSKLPANPPQTASSNGTKQQSSLKPKSATVNGTFDSEKAALNTRNRVGSMSSQYSNAALTYPWQNMGSFNEEKEFDRSFINDSQLIKAYVTETFHADWYWNTVLVFGTCFFAWVAARLRFGILGLVFVLLCSSSVYRAEFRRFRRNVRDDVQRIAASERLEHSFESMEWMNSFLKKFWVIYMPALSDTVKKQSNEILKDTAPGFGIEKVSLDEFTLGSKAPTVNSIKSYTKKGHDIVEMDWAFSFTPNDTSDMTKREIQKMESPKVALGVRVGKSFVSKSLPILVEDMSMTGRVKITLNLSQNFPHVKMVSVSLLEPPNIDFGLKPVGGDTLGLDIMTFIPGLSSLIKSIINSTAGPMLYAPNHFDIDVEEMMAVQMQDSIGVVALTLKGAHGLKEKINPYIQAFVDNVPEKPMRTDVKAETNSPSWNETKYILVNSLQQKLNIDLYNFNVSEKKGDLYASYDFDLNDLLQKDAFLNANKAMTSSGKKACTLNYDIRWFPVLKNEESASIDDDGLEVDTSDSEVGIFKFKLHQAKNLDNTISLTGKLNPKAELFIDGKSVHTFRTVKRSNEPAWEESVELLVTQKSATRVKLVLTDAGPRPHDIASLEESVDVLVFDVKNGEDTFKLSPLGDVRIGATWNPVSLAGVDASAHYVPPIGVARIHLRYARDLVNLETVGKVDPYVKVLLNNKRRYTTQFHPDTLDPEFNEVVFLPITSETEHVSLELFDEQNLGKDRPLGSTSFLMSDFITKNQENLLLFYDGSQKVLSAKLQRKNKKPKGNLFYSVSFIPSIPVFSIPELKELKAKEEELAAKKIEQEKQLKEEEELFKNNPDEYEWVEIDEEDVSDFYSKKQNLSLEELLAYKSGTLGIHVTGGTVRKADTFIQILFDDYASPALASSKTNNHSINPEVTDAFIRDLPNSTMILRNTKKAHIKETDQIIDEISFATIDVLKKCYYESTTIAFAGTSINLRLEYIPSAIKLPPLETVLDTGKAKIELLDAENLAPADRNGKADPYVTFSVGEIDLFKSSTIKKTLNPTWNETTIIPIISRSRPNIKLNVYDWDRAGSNDIIGSADFNISALPSGAPTLVTFKLKPQGSVRTRITFSPQYVRPKVGANEFGANLASLAGKGVGAATQLATGVVGGGVTAATGAVTGAVTGVTSSVGRSGTLIKKVVGGSKKNRLSIDQTRQSVDNTSGDIQSAKSAKSGHSKHPSTKSLDNTLQPPKARANGMGGISPLTSPKEDLHRSRSVSVRSSNSNTPKTRKSTSSLSGGHVIIRSGSHLGSQAQIRVSLAINGKLKEIHRTKNVKSSGGLIRWDEECFFNASPDSEIVVGGVIHHKFSRDEELGSQTVKLSDVSDTPHDISLELGRGTVTVSFRYTAP